MSILIKGMDMPKNCTECNFGVDGWCYAKSPTEPNSKSLATHTRPSWCPLIELPPHGDLIDRNSLRFGVLTEHFGTDLPTVITQIIGVINNVPAIIEK